MVHILFLLLCPLGVQSSFLQIVHMYTKNFLSSFFPLEPEEEKKKGNFLSHHSFSATSQISVKFSAVVVYYILVYTHKHGILTVFDSDYYFRNIFDLEDHEMAKVFLL